MKAPNKYIFIVALDRKCLAKLVVLTKACAGEKPERANTTIGGYVFVYQEDLAELRERIAELIVKKAGCIHVVFWTDGGSTGIHRGIREEDALREANKLLSVLGSNQKNLNFTFVGPTVHYNFVAGELCDGRTAIQLLEPCDKNGAVNNDLPFPICGGKTRIEAYANRVFENAEIE